MGVASGATPRASIHPKYPGANRVNSLMEKVERIQYIYIFIYLCIVIQGR